MEAQEYVKMTDPSHIFYKKKLFRIGIRFRLTSNLEIRMEKVRTWVHLYVFLSMILEEQLWEHFI